MLVEVGAEGFFVYKHKQKRGIITMDDSRNGKKRCFFKYSEDSLQKALDELKGNGKLKLREVARKYTVPHVTLRRRFMKDAGSKRRMGPETYLTTEEEDILVRWIMASAKRGIPLNKEALLDTIKEILDSDPSDRKVPFLNNRPGEKWFDCFLKRHTEISRRHTESVNLARAAVTEEDLRKWHTDLQTYLVNEGHGTILEDPSRIMNADESGFPTCPKTGSVLGPRGQKDFYSVQSGCEKENITALVTIAASGDVFPPLIVMPYERVPKPIAENMNPLWHIARSKTGWMTGPAFHAYVANCLIPDLKVKKVEFPVLFLIDGHKSHLTLQVAQLCSENGIILYSLYPNSTHIIQPADVAVFKPLKNNWKKVVYDWKKSSGNRAVTKHLFGPLFEAALNGVAPETVRKGFRKCGLFPFDANAIDFKKIMSHDSRVTAFKPTEFQTAHLLFVESMIPKGILLEFKKCKGNSNWEADEASKNLFFVWKKLRAWVGVDAESQETLPNTEGNQSSESGSQNAVGLYSNADLLNETTEENLFSNQATEVGVDMEYQDMLPDPDVNRTSAGSQTVLTAEVTRLLEKPTSEPKVSPSFADHILWPGESPTKKKRMRLPHAATSRRWLQFHLDLEVKKQKEADLKVKKKIDQEQKKQTKLAQLLERKRAREKKKGVKPIQKKSPKCVSSSEEEDLAEPMELLSDDCSWDHVSEEEPGGEPLQKVEVKDINTDDFVLVKYQAKNRSTSLLYYTGRVVEILTERLKIRYLRQRGKSFTFVYPPVEDLDDVDILQVVGKLTAVFKAGTSRTNTLIGFKENLSFYSSNLR